MRALWAKISYLQSAIRGYSKNLLDKQWGSLNVNITFLLINEIVQEKGRVGGG